MTEAPRLVFATVLLLLLSSCATATGGFSSFDKPPPPKLTPPIVEAGPLGDGYEFGVRLPFEWLSIAGELAVHFEEHPGGQREMLVSLPVTIETIFGQAEARLYIQVNQQDADAPVKALACLTFPADPENRICVDGPNGSSPRLPAPGPVPPETGSGIGVPTPAGVGEPMATPPGGEGEP